MRKLKRAVIKEELILLTGNLNAAIVLNQLLFWSERVKDSDDFLQEEIARAKKFNDGTVMVSDELKQTLLSGWVYKTAEDMITETMLTCSRKTMDRVFAKLVEQGYIDKRQNPKYKWDKTWQYRVNLQYINQKLVALGYALEGYSLPLKEGVDAVNIPNDDPKGQSDQPNGHGDDSKGQNDHSKGHFDQAIPKITTEITTNTTTKDKEIVDADAIDHMNPVVYEDVIAYLNQCTGRHYNPKAKGNYTYINARLLEGYSLQDLKIVIDNKVKAWLGTKWANYLRPSTLFNSTNFDAYLNEIPYKKYGGGQGHAQHKTGSTTADSRANYPEEWRNYSV